MKLDTAGTPPKPTHQDILKEELARDDHAQNPVSVCQHIATIARDAIERGDFEEGSSSMAAVHAILLKT